MTDIATLFNIDRKTCHRWMNEGLEPVEKGETPVLFMGLDLSNFLNKKRAVKRIVLKEDEFFCLKCHGSVRALASSEKTLKTGKKIGKDNSDQYVKSGDCEVCGTQVNRFLGVYQKD